jgi:hypothetical protein
MCRTAVVCVGCCISWSDDACLFDWTQDRLFVASPAQTGIPVVVSDHLKMLVRNMLSDLGDKFLSGRALEVYPVAPMGHGRPLEDYAGVLQVADLLF